MSFATGGRAVAATSTRSRSDSRANSNAFAIGTMPTCSPLGPTSRTSGTRIRSLMRGSVVMRPPRQCFGSTPETEKAPAHAEADDRVPVRTGVHTVQQAPRGPLGPGTRRPGGRCGWESELHFTPRYTRYREGHAQPISYPRG